MVFWSVVGAGVAVGFAIALFRARHGWTNRRQAWHDAQPDAHTSAWLSRLGRMHGGRGP